MEEKTFNTLDSFYLFKYVGNGVAASEIERVFIGSRATALPIGKGISLPRCDHCYLQLKAGLERKYEREEIPLRTRTIIN